MPTCDREGEGKPHLLYLTTEYPHISHTFIRREILGLEEHGYAITRVAVRPGQMYLDELDKDEASKTQYLLSGGRARVIKGLLGSGLAAIRILPEVLRLSRASHRGIINHFAYLYEALVLLAISKSSGIDHVHVHFGTNATTVAYLAWMMGGPDFSVTVHGPVEFDQPHGQSLGRKLAAAKFIVAISNYCRSQLYRWVPIHRWPDIHIVGCSVGNEWFDAAAPIPDDADTIVCVGRLDEQKGQVLLVDALAEARANGADQRLILIGDGELRREIEARIKAHYLEAYVEIAGWCDAEEIRARLLNARALVLASFAEGLPVVIMEAMALRRPILATRITGIPELVRDGIDGWLVTPGSHEILRDALQTLAATSTDQLNAMGSQAQQRVRARHLTEAVVAQLDGILRRYAHREFANET